MKYAKLKELISYYEQFENEAGLNDLNSFAFWMNNKLNNIQQAGKASDSIMLNSMMTRYLVMLSSHAKHYIKTALHDLPLTGMNDIVILLVLFYSGKMRKSDLIKESLVDFSPGIEVINRLVKQGYIGETKDEEDKRAKVVHITPEGAMLFQKVNIALSEISGIVAGNLTNGQKQMMVPLLEKLANFHEPIFKEDHGSDLKVIHRKYVGQSM